MGPYSLQWLQAQSELRKVYAARAFAIVQDDKIRRGDDWLRSAHNSTVFAADVPPYQGAAAIS